MRAYVQTISLFLSAASLTGQGAAACDETILLEYQVSNGRYQIELNDVYVDSGAGQATSGGIPIKEWLLTGENVIRVSTDADSGDFSVYAICDDGSGRRDFDEASLTGRRAASLTFQMPDPPQRIYLSAAPTSDEGLLDAVADLKAALTARDFDRVWARHAAMQADMALTDQPLKAAAYQMRKVVEAIEPDFAPGLRTRPVLGGRVWEVFGDEFAPPVSAVVSMNGGEIRFKTGSFWMLQDGKWSVLER